MQDGFTSKEAAHLAGISYRQIDYWARKRLVTPSLSLADPGSGRPRRYSFADVVALRTVGKLLQSGVSTKAVGHVAIQLQRFGEGQPLGKVRLVASGDDIVVVTDKDAAMSVLREPGQGVLQFIVDIGAVIRELDASLAQQPPETGEPPITRASDA
jgi:DNA-binding transcriptional MerR regulator